MNDSMAEEHILPHTPRTPDIPVSSSIPSTPSTSGTRLTDFASAHHAHTANIPATPIVPRITLPMIDKSIQRMETPWIKTPQETAQLEIETPAPQYALSWQQRDITSEIDTLEQPSVSQGTQDLVTPVHRQIDIHVVRGRPPEQPPNEKRLNWRDIQLLRQFVTPFKGRILLAFFLTMSIGLTALPMPFILRLLLDTVFSKHDVQLFFWLLASLFSVFLVEEIVRFFTRNALGALSRSANLTIIYRFYRHILRLPLAFYDGHASTGQLLSRLNEVISAQQTIIQVVIDTAVNSVLTLIYLGVLFLTDWHLTLALLGITPFYTAINLYFNRRTRHLSRNMLENYAEMNGLLYEGLSGLKTIKALAAEHRFARMVKRLIVRTNQASARRALFQSKTFLTIGVVQALSIICVLGYGGSLVLNGTLTTGQLAAFILVLHELASPVSALNGINQQLQIAVVATDRLFSLLNYPEEADAEKGFELTTLAGHIAFQHVHFSYLPGIEVLHDITLDIPAGATIAIVGKSGSGKTTLANLLMRFYAPDHGIICIDGYDLRDLKIEALRKQFGVILQDEAFFSGTIEENLLFGLLCKVSYEELVTAARNANILDFILEQPLGFKTVLQERGQNLSTGQRQRLAIARMFLRQPAILLMDEPSSALDNESEALIQPALRRLRKGRTTFIIAHRLSTIRDVDRILVLDDGWLAEQGTHEELLARQGVYWHLYTSYGRV